MIPRLVKNSLSKQSPRFVNPKSIRPSSAPISRPFSSSTRVQSGSDSYNAEDVVPPFYVRRKQQRVESASDAQRDAILQRTGEETSLMERLSDGILSDEIAASTRRLKTKIPTELFNAEGELVHPSGFVIPTPGEASEPMSEKRERDLAQQTAAVAERVLEEDFTDVSAATRSRDNKVPWEVRQKDGTVAHPSGFVPPTPIHGFKVSMSADPPSLVSRRDLDWGAIAEDPEESAPIKSAPTNGGLNAHRGMHSSAVSRAEAIDHFPLDHAPLQRIPDIPQSPRIR